RRLAHDLRAITVRKDETAFVREDGSRHIRMGGEEEAVGMQAVFWPLAVDAEILDRGFDLDDPAIALTGKRHEIGAPAGGERQFRKDGCAHLHEQALDATPYHHGAFGLPAVGKRIDGNRRDDWHGP